MEFLLVVGVALLIVLTYIFRHDILRWLVPPNPEPLPPPNPKPDELETQQPVDIVVSLKDQAIHDEEVKVAKEYVLSVLKLTDPEIIMETIGTKKFITSYKTYLGAMSPSERDEFFQGLKLINTALAQALRNPYTAFPRVSEDETPKPRQ